MRSRVRLADTLWRRVERHRSSCQHHQPAPPAVSALAGVVSSGPEIARWSGGRGRGSHQTIARTERQIPHGTEGFSGSFSALQNTTARCVFNLIRLWGSLRFPARAKWNGLVLWSVRARARTAVHGAVGSPLGPSGVLTPARRRASSVLRSAVCVRSRGLRSSPLRSAAPRGSGPAHSGLPDSASAYSTTPALLPTAPPPEIRSANRNPALQTPATRAFRAAADPPAVLRPSALRSSARKSARQQSRRPHRTVFEVKGSRRDSNPRPSGSQLST